MKEIGIRELKAKASGLVNKVAESHVTYVITKHGHPVGVLAPADHLQPPTRELNTDAWNQLFLTADKINTCKKSGKPKSAVRELSEMRR